LLYSFYKEYKSLLKHIKQQQQQQQRQSSSSSVSQKENSSERESQQAGGDSSLFRSELKFYKKAGSVEQPATAECAVKAGFANSLLSLLVLKQTCHCLKAEEVKEEEEQTTRKQLVKIKQNSNSGKEQALYSSSSRDKDTRNSDSIRNMLISKDELLKMYL
jgi:hypothetical protein